MIIWGCPPGRAGSLGGALGGPAPGALGQARPPPPGVVLAAPPKCLVGNLAEPLPAGEPDANWNVGAGVCPVCPPGVPTTRQPRPGPGAAGVHRVRRGLLGAGGGGGRGVRRAVPPAGAAARPGRRDGRQPGRGAQRDGAGSGGGRPTPAGDIGRPGSRVTAPPPNEHYPPPDPRNCPGTRIFFFTKQQVTIKHLR